MVEAVVQSLFLIRTFDLVLHRLDSMVSRNLANKDAQSVRHMAIETQNQAALCRRVFLR